MKTKRKKRRTTRSRDRTVPRTRALNTLCFITTRSRRNRSRFESLIYSWGTIHQAWFISACFSSTKCFSFRGKKSSFACKSWPSFPLRAMRYFRVAQKERALFGLENKSKFTFLGKSWKRRSLLNCFLWAVFFSKTPKLTSFSLLLSSSSTFIFRRLYMEKRRKRIDPTSDGVTFT